MALGYVQLRQFDAVSRDLIARHDIHLARHRHDWLAPGLCLPGWNALGDRCGRRPAIDFLTTLSRLGIRPTPVSLGQEHVARGEKLVPWDIGLPPRCRIGAARRRSKYKRSRRRTRDRCAELRGKGTT